MGILYDFIRRPNKMQVLLYIVLKLKLKINYTNLLIIMV